uniref:SGNH hydrolase-type esterase domain-containing protein n=1 Tax=Salvator merianae TaxID=96440 RepID=A0A8D0KK09_SALMN
KLVSLLEERVKSLEEKVATLKLIREDVNFLNRAEETLRNDAIEENLAVPAEADGWKHVTQRSRKIRRYSAPLQLKNRFQPLSQENNEDIPQDITTLSTKSTLLCSQKPLERRDRSGTVKKNRRVVVVGDSLLRGTEAAVCRPDRNSREVCCLPGARIKDVTDSLSRLFSPTDYYPFLLIHVGTNDTARKDFATVCSDFEDLGKKVKELGAQVVFSSILPVDGHGKRRWDRILEVNNWLRQWCYQQGFGFLNHGENYLYDGLLARDGLHLTKTGKNVFGKRLASLIRRALN